VPMPRRVVDLLRQGIDDGLHLGAQAYASVDGETRLDLAVGEARKGAPMQRETLVLWLSACKPVTAVAVAQQIEAGRLELDRPVAADIPEFGPHDKDSITLRHVLTHTGGFRAAPFKYPRDDWDTIIAAICDARLEPRWTPGVDAGYHPHTGWFILAELVKRASGLPFARYVREHVFDRLGMDDCWVGMDGDAYGGYVRDARLAATYDTEGPRPKPHTWHQRAWVTGVRPGGNGYGPARQVARLYEALLNGGAHPDRPDSPVLTADTVARLTDRHRSDTPDAPDRTFKHPMDWGLGFILGHDPYEPKRPYSYGPHASAGAFGHGGYQSSVAFADPAHGLAAAVVCNGTPGERGHHLRMQPILAALYEELGLAS